MSILIKGLKIPISCNACLYESDICTCKALEVIFGNLKNDHKCSDSGRREDCPLIDIPDEFRGPGQSEPANAWWDGYRTKEKSLKLNDIYNSGFDKGYEEGLKDAWEDAKKLALGTDHGGIATSDIFEIFDVGPYQVFQTMEIEDVHQILDEYFEKKAEERQKTTKYICKQTGAECPIFYQVQSNSEGML